MTFDSLSFLAFLVLIYIGYYCRGLATIQHGKPKEAKADLLKVIALAPASDEAKEAKEYLKSIK